MIVPSKSHHVLSTDPDPNPYPYSPTSVPHASPQCSTLQCLRGMPELRSALGSVTEGGGGGSLAPMAAQLRDLLNELDHTPGAVAPQRFTGSLRANFPNFAQQGRGGGFMQHDAEELLSVVHSVLKDGLSSVDKSLDTYMNINMQETMTCKESDAEPAKVCMHIPIHVQMCTRLYPHTHAHMSIR